GLKTRKQLLVVDDELSIREILAEGLEGYGFPVRMASSAAEALEIVRGGGIHLVLSDIDMPGGNGIELLKRIKAVHPDLDVIMVTGVVDVDTAMASIHDGASDYVTKPFNLEEVRIAVEQALDERRLILENRAYQLRLEEMVSERTRELVEKK